jgi:hypothetical protein
MKYNLSLLSYSITVGSQKLRSIFKLGSPFILPCFYFKVTVSYIHSILTVMHFHIPEY